MILADTSAWIEYVRANRSACARRMKSLVFEGGLLAVTEPVIMEVLAGARTENDLLRLRRMMLTFPLLSFEPVADFDGAVATYRACRSAGVTPRGMLDCMIAAVALRTGASVLTADVDLVRMSTVLGITLDTASTKR